MQLIILINYDNFLKIFFFFSKFPIINKKEFIPISSRSKKIHHNRTKEKYIKSLSKENPISLFIDPFLSHRIYRDFLIPNHQLTPGEPIQQFKNYLSYKSLAQVNWPSLFQCILFQEL